MKIKAAVRYYLKDFQKPTIIYYGVMMALYLLQILLTALFHDSFSSSSMETSSRIFLFVIGLNSFKPQLRLFLQNGISRKTLFTGFAAGLLVVAAAMSILDLAFGWFRGLFAPYTTIYMARFSSLYVGRGAAALAEELLWSFLAYVTSGMTGFFLTSLYYRMNKGLKLAVSIGVPMFCLIVIPLIDSQFTNWAILSSVINVTAFAFGAKVTVNLADGLPGLLDQLFSLGNGIPLYPYRAMLFSILCTAVMGPLSFLLIRRATVKD